MLHSLIAPKRGMRPPSGGGKPFDTARAASTFVSSPQSAKEG